jgi:RHS repeat-associated protein
LLEYIYTLTCTGPAGTISKSVIVTVNTIQCPPACGGGDTHWLPPQHETIVTAPLRENMNWSSEPPAPKSHHLARPPLQSGGSTIIRTTYSLAGQTIATRVTGDPVSSNNGLFFILSDHLGSTSLLTTSNGSVVPGSATWYLPFGGYRGATPTQTITDRDYTGQRENMELDLLYYGARFYIPGLGRFASADSIVPNPMNPQSLNRYTYVLNRPLKFTDPSGHSYCDEMLEECGSDTPLPPQQPLHPGLPTLPNKNPVFRHPLSHTDNPSISQNFIEDVHDGVDYNEIEGTSVHSSTTGVVVVSSRCSLRNCVGQQGSNAGWQKAGANNGYGNMILIEYGYEALPKSVRETYGLEQGESLYVLYAHLLEASTYNAGDTVNTGDLIGSIGNSGNSSGAHLHVEVRSGTSEQIFTTGRFCDISCASTEARNTWFDLDLENPELVWE